VETNIEDSHDDRRPPTRGTETPSPVIVGAVLLVILLATITVQFWSPVPPAIFGAVVALELAVGGFIIVNVINGDQATFAVMVTEILRELFRLMRYLFAGKT
jgi:hypothetical protein